MSRRIVTDEYHYEHVDETTFKYTPPQVAEVKCYAAPVSYFHRSPSCHSYTIRPRSSSRSSTYRSECQPTQTSYVDIRLEETTVPAPCAPCPPPPQPVCVQRVVRQPRQETRVCRFDSAPRRSVSRSTLYDDGENSIDIKVETNDEVETTSICSRPRSTSRTRSSSRTRFQDGSVVDIKVETDNCGGDRTEITTYEPVRPRSLSRSATFCEKKNSIDVKYETTQQETRRQVLKCPSSTSYTTFLAASPSPAPCNPCRSASSHHTTTYVSSSPAPAPCASSSSSSQHTTTYTTPSIKKVCPAISTYVRPPISRSSSPSPSVYLARRESSTNTENIEIDYKYKYEETTTEKRLNPLLSKSLTSLRYCEPAKPKVTFCEEVKPKVTFVETVQKPCRTVTFVESAPAPAPKKVDTTTITTTTTTEKPCAPINNSLSYAYTLNNQSSQHYQQQQQQQQPQPQQPKKACCSSCAQKQEQPQPQPQPQPPKKACCSSCAQKGTSCGGSQQRQHSHERQESRNNSSSRVVSYVSQSESQNQAGSSSLVRCNSSSSLLPVTRSCAVGSLFNGSSFGLLTESCRIKDNFSCSFDFRTSQGNGVLMMVVDSFTNDSFFVELCDSQLKATLYVNGEPDSCWTNFPTPVLSNDIWVDVNVEIIGNKLTMSVKNQHLTKYHRSTLRYPIRGDLFVAGFPSYLRVPYVCRSRDFFVGEMRNFLVNHEGIKWYGVPTFITPRLRNWC